MTRGFVTAPSLVSAPEGVAQRARALPQEDPIALVYNGTTLAVMMATPADLRNFALGFSLSEGIITQPEQIEEFQIVPHAAGMELQMWLCAEREQMLSARRRALAGPVGCGLCGIDSLEQAIRPVPVVPANGLRLTGADISDAVQSLRNSQPLHDETRAVHAAGFYVPGKGVVHVREDVGRHNALDKLIGALAHSGQNPSNGALVLTSRVSVEMVQKCAMAGIQTLIAVSAPTARGVTTAQEAGITLTAMARNGRYEIFTHAQRIVDDAPQGDQNEG